MIYLDAKISQIVMKPARFNKEGELVDDEHAVLTLKIPMDSLTQKKEVVALNELLDKEHVNVDVGLHPLEK